MIVLNINHTGYKMLLHTIALLHHIPYKGEDFINIPPHLGKGYMKALSLFNELEMMLLDVVLKQPLISTREHSDTRYFVLHFDNMYITDTVSIMSALSRCLSDTMLIFSPIKMYYWCNGQKEWYFRYTLMVSMPKKTP